MNTKKHQLENYKRFLLSRVTSNTPFVEFLDNCLVSEDEAASYCFHKIMIHNWTSETSILYETLSSYFSASFIPVNCSANGDLTVFYTSSLSLILKIIKFDFMFPYQRNMFNMDVLFYDKSAEELLDNNIKIEDIVAGVVSRRFSEHFVLDLSNFCNDPEFQEKNIHFYKITLLSYFKLLMIRIGRETKELNLSNNNLSQPPLEILNFFIKGDFISVNLSHNNIASISDLIRVSSKIEKLWLEGNPLCEDMEATSYVKSLITKFPRLRELDGIKLNNVMLPFIKNFVPPSNKLLKMFLEKFIMLYFTHYDSPKRKSIYNFYDPQAKLTITTKFNDGYDGFYNQNASAIMDQSSFPVRSIFGNIDSIFVALSNLPPSFHDPTSFTVDVLSYEKRRIIVVIDGVFKEVKLDKSPTRFIQFRRTFVFAVNKNNFNSTFHITNELYSMTNASEEQINNCFKYPIRNMNSLALINPDKDEMDTFIKIFMNITQLKKEEAETRLILHNWVLKEAIEVFTLDMKLNKIPKEKLIDEDDISDISSLIDDEID